MGDAEPILHPESTASLEACKSLWEGFLSSDSESVKLLRRTMDEIAKVNGIGVAKDFKGTREELFADSKEVDGGIPVYVYKPKSMDHESDGIPILIYFHGGGNVFGSRDLVDDTCKMLSSQAGCIVVSVEYRLAPEHKFPAMMIDAYDAVRWVLHNRNLVGGSSKSKVGVAGDSAGGQIAASVSHHVPGVDFQVLVYPYLNGGDRDLPSYEEFGKGPVINDEFRSWLESLMVEKIEDQRDPRFGILRNEKYKHLPPTLLIVAEIDPVRDDSYEYSKRLTAAGVDSEIVLIKGAIHGFFTAPGTFVKLCDMAYTRAVEFINKFQ